MASDAIIRIEDQLLVSLSGDTDDQTLADIQERLSREVERTSAKGVLIDVAGTTILDSFLARMLAKTVYLVRLMGAEAVVVGVQPAVAITLIELGLDFDGVPTALNAGLGIRKLKQLREQGELLAD